MKYNKQLDGIRFLAIFFVLLEHFPPFLGSRFSSGFYGVDLFFVISGFLITSILLNSEGSYWHVYRNFLGRRTLRIFPLYYLTNLVLLLLGDQGTRQHLFYCLSYTLNYAIVAFDIPPMSIRTYWSLCVEEQFYLICPFLVLGLRNRLGVLKWILAAVIVAGSLQLCFELISSVNPYNYYGLFPRANSLAMGVLGAVLAKEKRLPLRLLESAWIEIVAIVGLVLVLIYGENYKYLVSPFVSLFLVAKTTHKGFKLSLIDRFLRNRQVVYIGSIAYGIYLIHPPLGHFLDYQVGPYLWTHLPLDSMGILGKIKYNVWVIPYLKFPVYCLITFLLAHLSFRYIEKPILSFKDRWFAYQRAEPQRAEPQRDKSVLTRLLRKVRA